MQAKLDNECFKTYILRLQNCTIVTKFDDKISSSIRLKIAESEILPKGSQEKYISLTFLVHSCENDQNSSVVFSSMASRA